MGVHVGSLGREETSVYFSRLLLFSRPIVRTHLLKRLFWILSTVLLDIHENIDTRRFHGCLCEFQIWIVSDLCIHANDATTEIDAEAIHLLVCKLAKLICFVLGEYLMNDICNFDV